MKSRADSRFTKAATTGTSTRGASVQDTSTQGTTRYRTVRGTTTAVAVVNGILLWRRFTQATRKASVRVRETVSAAGWLLLTVAVFGWVLGLAFGWIELVVAAAIATALLVLAIPFLFGTRAYDVSFTLERDRVVAGNDVHGEIGVRNAGKAFALPGQIELPIGEGIVELDVPLLRGGAEHQEELRIPARERGIIDVGPACTVRGDPLGILRRERTWKDIYKLYIHPVTTAIPSTSTGFIRDLEGHPSSKIVSDDLSFHAIREYQPGDSRRQVHWKSTAKTGQLMVRQYEETRRSQMVVALASSSDEFRDAEEFELAVSAAASIGVRGIRDDRDVQVLMGGDIPEFARTVVRSVRELNTRNPRALLDDLAGVSLSERVNLLTEVAGLAVERFADVSIVFLVCGSAVSARTLRLAALAFPVEIAVVAVICDPHSEPGFRSLGDITVVSIGLIDDLRHLLARGSDR